MPSTHHFLSDPYLYVARFTGILTLAELMEGVAICRRSPVFSPAMPQLIDLAAVTDIDAGFHDLRRFLAALERAYRGNDRDVTYAILTAGDHFYGSARQFQLLSESTPGLSGGVFADPAECLAALALPDRSVDALLARAVPARAPD